MTERVSTPEERRALKLSTQRLIRQCGGQEFSASLTRVSHQTLSDCGNTTGEKHVNTFLALDVALDLILDRTQHGEVPALLRDLCRLAGGVFVPLPDPDARGAFARETAAAVKESGEAVSALVQALADDGEVTPDEIRAGHMIPQLRETVEAFTCLLAHCEDALKADAEKTGVAAISGRGRQ
ncbi:phage regulatory CII family protein [Roseibium suaedae]|uniref:Uncharacterized protein n=1 Tax=Roseibium suaedae TaxID=735517 RepID=A0A1M7PMN9_9HYPH|nr:hypothetical protein [Roseibium suaedae]SHN18499.1 hypothetical protein SAMN05444272_4519 [Roseibium suaedae]